MTEPEDNFIPGIFNYCDRWCERCEFTSRCRVFADERSHALDDSDDPMGDALQVVAESFAEAKQMLIEKAEEMGIDIEATLNDPEIAESIERQRKAVESIEVVELARRYTMETRQVLERAEERIGEHEDDPMIGEMLEIIHWYLFMVAVKVHSCFHAVLDIDGDEDPNEITDPQSHANGVAKLTLICVERSMLAWTYLVSDSNRSLIQPIIERLEIIKQAIENKFPHARDFIRPGFDELDVVM